MTTERHSHSTVKGLLFLMPCNDQDYGFLLKKKKTLCCSFVVSCKNKCACTWRPDTPPPTHVRMGPEPEDDKHLACMQMHAHTHGGCCNFTRSVGGPRVCFCFSELNCTFKLNCGASSCCVFGCTPLCRHPSVRRVYILHLSYFADRFIHRKPTVTTRDCP